MSYVIQGKLNGEIRFLQIMPMPGACHPHIWGPEEFAHHFEDLLAAREELDTILDEEERKYVGFILTGFGKKGTSGCYGVQFEVREFLAIGCYGEAMDTHLNYYHVGQTGVLNTETSLL